MAKVGFLQSGEGRWSLTRLLALCAFFVAATLAILTIFMENVSFGDAFPLTITFLAYSLGQKTFDKISVMFGKNEEKG